jgi:uncharacterized membrane protein YphA (DoxX/SURF4 family)
VRSALPWLGLALRLGAAGIWFAAGIAKLTELEHFRSQVAAYDLLPGSLVSPFAYALPFVEVFLGLYLALGLLTRPAAIATSLLMLLFIIALSQAWARGLVLDCGCFGGIAREKVGAWAVVRDTALGIPGVLLAVWPARRLSLDARLLGLPDRFRLRA